MSKGVPVLMYHSVKEDAPHETRALSVAPAAFEWQMRHLREQGFTSLTFEEYAQALDAGRAVPAKTVVITFDDGYADTLEVAAPLLARSGLVATAFVTTGWLADAGRLAAGRPLDRMMTKRQVNDLAEHGVEIGAHSHSHAHLDQIGRESLRRELADSRAILEDVLGRPVRTVAYPFGHSSAPVRSEVAEAGYAAAAAVENALAKPARGVLAVPRLTIRRSTSPAEFARLVDGRGLLRSFALDRALTNGYKIVRRLQRARPESRTEQH